jgi:hypothetical protein
MCFPDRAAMLMLPLLLIQFVLQFLVHGSNAECAIGSVNENARWITSNGRLKNYDSDISLDAGKDDYFLFQATCTESNDYDDFDESCNCTFTNSKL